MESNHVHVDNMPHVSMSELRSCVHCGFCLPTCPTYQVFGVEMDSPRGRIMQIEAAKRGEIDRDDPQLLKHLSLCLACRACETACPSGVPYGRIIEGARASLPAPRRTKGLIQRTVLRGVFAHPALLDLAGTGMRFYQQSGVQGLVRRVPMPRELADLEQLLPTAQGKIVQRARKTRYLPVGRPRTRVALVRGCVMQQFFASTNEATARVLAENGCEVVAPAAARCCGALHVHAGDRRAALALARKNIDEFMSLRPDYIVINAAGCGSTLKEYGHLLAGDPEYAERAVEFSRRVKDISELLVDLQFRAPKIGIRGKITYQDACHLLHAQRIRDQPRAVLRSIPGLELIEMRESDNCCGSAGIYNITQPETAMRLLDKKMVNVLATGAELLAAANPGCAIQLAAGVRRSGARIKVVHPIDLLDAAYRAERRHTRSAARAGGV
jgi:glycolate oxidase iron-sulfur subunit